MASARRPTNTQHLSCIKDRWPELQRELKELVEREVLVGFPEDTTQRKQEAVVGHDQPTNAELAYIHDNGDPAHNIPARPFMLPAMDNARGAVTRTLGNVCRALVRKGANSTAGLVDKGYHAVGLIVQAAIRSKINEGIPPPLSERTLRDREARGRKGAAQELANRAAGMPASTDLAKPLVDTAQMRNAANYVIRPRRARKL